SRGNRSALGWTRTWCSITGLLAVSGGGARWWAWVSFPGDRPRGHHSKVRNPYIAPLRICENCEFCGCYVRNRGGGTRRCADVPATGRTEDLRTRETAPPAP